jgi:hypothetical protein
MRGRLDAIGIRLELRVLHKFICNHTYLTKLVGPPLLVPNSVVTASLVVLRDHQTRLSMKNTLFEIRVSYLKR